MKRMRELLILLGLVIVADVYSQSDTVWIADFEKNPHPEGWQIEGYAFGSLRPGPLPYNVAIADLNQRQMMSGSMGSSSFNIEKPYLVLEMAGSFNPGRCYVDVLVEGETICRMAPNPFFEDSKTDPLSEWYAVDLSDYIGKQAELHFVDDYEYGWITPNRVFLCDHTDIKKAPYLDVRNNPLAGNNPLIRNPNPKKNNMIDNPRMLPERLVHIETQIPDWKKELVEIKAKGENLLLPAAKDAHVQDVVISVGGNELRIPFPLSFDPSADLIPVFSLSQLKGKNISMEFSHPEIRSPEKILMMGDIPARGPDFPKSFHIRCRLGRLNDPNGLVYHEGVYHLFHQYSYAVRGKMWAHYTSTDLVHWEERPIAIFPDKFGSMHSGSGIVDHLNTAGFQTTDIAPIVLIYSISSVFNPVTTKVQAQGLAYSNDSGLTFQKHDGGNPVLGNWIDTETVADHERDPKVIWYSPTELMNPFAEDGHWVMALFEGERINPGGSGIQLYTSSDLKNWEKGGFTDSFHECPEFFPLALDGDPEKIYWIMYGANGDYLIGQFDGHSFSLVSEEKIAFPDGGRWYAGQSFSNLPGNPPRRVHLSWSSEILSVPIEATLRTTPLGIRMCSLPIKELNTLRTESQNMDGSKLSPNGENPFAGFDSALGDIELKVELQNGVDLDLVVRGQRLSYRAGSRLLSFGEGRFASDIQIPVEMKSLDLRVLFDDEVVDVFVGEYGLFYTSSFVDAENTDELKLQIKGGSATFSKLRVHKLKSIWH